MITDRQEAISAVDNAIREGCDLRTRERNILVREVAAKIEQVRNAAYQRGYREACAEKVM